MSNLRCSIYADSLNIIDDLNKDYVSDNYILLSFDIVNMYPSIDNVRGITAVTSFLNMRKTKLALTECIIRKGLRICLYHNNSIFTGVNKTMGQPQEHLIRALMLT